LKETLEQTKALPSDNQALLIARVHASLGETDQAIEWLEKAYEQRAFGVFFLKVDPTFDSLRSDERFKDLLGRIGLK
jgi:hypothetical protein